MALFDLDGTLSESGEGILLCVRKIFEEMERPLPDERTLGTFIGPPMYDSLRMCGFSHEDAEKGVEIYKRNFLESGIYMNRLYPLITQSFPMFPMISLRRKHPIRTTTSWILE